MKKVESSHFLLDSIKAAYDVQPAMKFGCSQGSFILDYKLSVGLST